VWHEKQNEWLERWQPGRALPLPEEKQRRTEWDKLTKQHARALKAADDRRHRPPPGPPPAPKKRGAPRTLTDEEREAAAERHKQAKRRHSKIQTKVQRWFREKRERAAVTEYAARQAARQVAQQAAQQAAQQHGTARQDPVSRQPMLPVADVPTVQEQAPAPSRIRLKMCDTCQSTEVLPVGSLVCDSCHERHLAEWRKNQLHSGLRPASGALHVDNLNARCQ